MMTKKLDINVLLCTVSSKLKILAAKSLFGHFKIPHILAAIPLFGQPKILHMLVASLLLKHKNTAHVGRNRWHCSCGCCSRIHVRRSDFSQGIIELKTELAVDVLLWYRFTKIFEKGFWKRHLFWVSSTELTRNSINICSILHTGKCQPS